MRARGFSFRGLHYAAALHPEELRLLASHQFLPAGSIYRPPKIGQNTPAVGVRVDGLDGTLAVMVCSRAAGTMRRVRVLNEECSITDRAAIAIDVGPFGSCRIHPGIRRFSRRAGYGAFHERCMGRSLRPGATGTTLSPILFVSFTPRPAIAWLQSRSLRRPIQSSLPGICYGCCAILPTDL